MTFCEHCGEKINFLPFKCKYCGGSYCKEHRLPENHQCTFELKNIPSITSNLREAPAKKGYSRGTSRSFKKYMKRQDKQKQKTIKLYKNDNVKRLQNNTTTYLLITIVVMSIVGTVFPLYLTLSRFSFLDFWLWTFLTSIFVSYSPGIFGLFILLLLMIFFYVLIKNLERAFGTKFLIQLYLICALFSGLVYFILWLIAEMFLIPSGFIIIVPYGLASGALLGVICFTIFMNWSREMTFLIFFIPIRMKGRTIIIFLILIKLIPGLLFAIGDPSALIIYLPDLGGLLASYLVYNYKFKNR